ncbi:unnamed protein product [Pylaiella littoralis]
MMINAPGWRKPSNFWRKRLRGTGGSRPPLARTMNEIITPYEGGKNDLELESGIYDGFSNICRGRWSDTKCGQRGTHFDTSSAQIATTKRFYGCCRFGKSNARMKHRTMMIIARNFRRLSRRNIDLAATARA